MYAKSQTNNLFNYLFQIKIGIQFLVDYGEKHILTELIEYGTIAVDEEMVLKMAKSDAEPGVVLALLTSRNLTPEIKGIFDN